MPDTGYSVRKENHYFINNAKEKSMKTTDLHSIARKLQNIKEDLDTLLWRLDDRDSPSTIDTRIAPYQDIGNELIEVLSELKAHGHIKLNEIDRDLKFRN